MFSLEFLKDYFSIYIDLLMLCIGLYMTFLQSVNLAEQENSHIESKVCKAIGIIYLIIAIFGFVILFI